MLEVLNLAPWQVLQTNLIIYFQLFFFFKYKKYPKIIILKMIKYLINRINGT